MRTLSLLAAGAYAANVKIYEDYLVRMDLEYYLQGEDLYFISTQSILEDIDVATTAQMLFLTESMSSVILAAFENQSSDGEGMPMTFLDGFLGMYMPVLGIDLMQSICALKGDPEPSISNSCPWKEVSALANFDDFATSKEWTIAGKRSLTEYYTLKENTSYSLITSYTMEDALGVEYESREPYLTEILLVDEPSGALAGFAASAVAILAALTF